MPISVFPVYRSAPQALLQPTDLANALASGLEAGSSIATNIQGLPARRLRAQLEAQELENVLRAQQAPLQLQKEQLDIQNAINAPQREQEAFRNRLALLGAEKPELGIQVQENIPELGFVAEPNIVTPEQQAAIDQGASIVPRGSIQRALFHGVVQNPEAAQQAIEREAQQKLQLAQSKPFEVSPGATLTQFDPKTGKYETMLTAPNRPAKERQFLVKDKQTGQISNIGLGEGEQLPDIFEFYNKPASTEMTPAQVISAGREVRNVYDELPSKIDFFGKGQIPGSDQLKTRLDAVLKPTLNKQGQPNYSKLNPQAANTFIFALNKLRDPTSATLLAEASQIAGRAGILDRFGAYIENIKSGNQISPQVAKDIYDVISQVHSAHKENLINSLIPLKEDLDSVGKKFTSIGVPPDIAKEVENRVSGMKNVFDTIEEAESASLPKGTHITINGRPAIIE